MRVGKLTQWCTCVCVRGETDRKCTDTCGTDELGNSIRRQTNYLAVGGQLSLRIFRKCKHCRGNEERQIEFPQSHDSERGWRRGPRGQAGKLVGTRAGYLPPLFIVEPICPATAVCSVALPQWSRSCATWRPLVARRRPPGVAISCSGFFPIAATAVAAPPRRTAHASSSASNAIAI